MADLNRYNEAGHLPGSFAFWKHILRQAYVHPGLFAVMIYRYGQWCRRCRIPVARQILDISYFVYYSMARFLLQIELPRETEIGPGLRIDHYGGILVNSQAKIGSNFTLTQGVLVGATESGVPRIGNDVHCGVGCKIIGGIELGDCIKIGTSAVVTRSYPGYVVLAGVPARVLRSLECAPLSNGWIPPQSCTTVESEPVTASGN